jgi:hypothetical protein
MKERVLPRLGHLGVAPAEAAAWSQLFSETGLVVRLLIDETPGAGYVGAHAVDVGEEWLRQGQENLRRITPEGALKVIDEDSGLMRCAVGDGHDGSRATVLESLLPGPAPFGVFATVPHRDALLVLPVTREAMEKKALAVLKAATEKEHAGAAHPLSAELYWVMNGVWRPFTIVVVPEGAIRMRPPAELVQALMTLLGEPKPEGG